MLELLISNSEFRDQEGAQSRSDRIPALWDPKLSTWRRKWQPTPVFLPEESNGQRSLTGYSPWGHRVGQG